MGRFFPVYISRSDGKIELVNKHRQKERNEPIPEQLDKTPDAKGMCDYYREVDMDEQKHLDWRRKLGGMLARDIGLAEQERGYMLATFPEYYRLYEHVKKAADDSKVKTVKNHAGGGNDRQDAYLYGHPQGRKKRYRSPADFYPHLYWLATDERGDPDNCACKICCPEELDSAAYPIPEKSPTVRKEDRGSTKMEQSQRQGAEKSLAVKKESQPQRQAVVEVPRPSKEDLASFQAASAKATQRASASQSKDQRLDLASESSIFRTGELVWFAQTPQSWGLGVVASMQRMAFKFGQQAAQLDIQPLSHPYKAAASHMSVTEGNVRPWLAWSVPGFTHKALDDIPNLQYDNADWSGILNGKYGRGEIDVDASILAAKSIDLSLSPAEEVQAISSEPTAHAGVYLGAEKIWVGDAVRLRGSRPHDILVISRIVSHSQAAPTKPSARTLTLFGDVYSLGATLSSSIDVTPTLPAPIRADLQRRNAALARLSKPQLSYAIRETNTTVDTRNVKGRWYAATALRPILVGQAAAARELESGELQDSGVHLNGRLDRPGAVEAWHATRRDALGRAVPGEFVIGEQQQQQQPPPLPPGDGNADFDGLMNLDT